MSHPAAKVLLIVVDNPAHRVMFNRYLARTPHHLVFAADGEDGYDRYAEVKPDLVIAHLNVARLDGTILCQLLRQQPRGDQVPVVLIGDESADDERTKKRLAAVGADRFLPVPFSGTVLEECVSGLLAAGRPARLEVQLEPPTQALFAQDLKLAPVGGLDFPERTDAPSVPSLMESGDLPVLPHQAEVVDVDTVVSFQNPFFEGAGPVASTLRAPVPIEAHPAADLDSPGPLPPSQDDTADTGRLPSMLEDEPAHPIGASPVPRIDSVLTDGFGAGGHAQILEEQPISETGNVSPTPTKDLSTKSRLLLEPPIGGGPASPAPVEAPKEGSGKSRLIQELPREERTPTGEAQDHGGGARRGLDESQLGKRLAKRVRTMHRLLEEVDYYQLLGLEAGATGAQLRSAYFDLSLEFHPDRFFLLRSGELKEKIYSIYRRIQEAYRVLADEVLRREYDELRASKSGERPELVLATAPPTGLGGHSQEARAAALLGHAEGLYRQGDLDGARLFLHLARHYDPQEPALEAALQKVVQQIGPTI